MEITMKQPQQQQANLQQRNNRSDIKRFLVISNICKGNNIRTLCKAAFAYGFSIIFVGPIQTNITLEVIECITVTDLKELKVYLNAANIPLIGIEIVDQARSILENPFEQSIALMPGNEGTGLSSRQKSVVDYFVYIPQYGHGTASLNVTVATTMVMHRYTSWCNSVSSEVHKNEVAATCSSEKEEK